MEPYREKLDSAISELFIKLESHLRNINSDTLRFYLLKWMLAVTSDMSDYYTKILNQRMKASEITKVFMEIPAVNAYIKLLNSTLKHLVDDSPATVMECLLEALRVGLAFDWMLLHIT